VRSHYQCEGPTTASLKNSLFPLLSICLLTLTACGTNNNAKNKEPLSKSEIVQKVPKLLDLGAHKCAPCKRNDALIRPIISRTLSEKTKGRSICILLVIFSWNL
jgi:hypothetical protein